ncbi:MAG: hypothetical protein EOO41_00930 [Methanobacteriota archaeon]|nr:MAG: hypothetical protein EOO41_00930 [Euryarchaeota archaeon]
MSPRGWHARAHPSLHPVRRPVQCPAVPTRHSLRCHPPWVEHGAAGEAAIETFLTSLRTHWSLASWEIAPYRGRTLVVRGWDVVLGSVEDQLASLANLKLSPYVAPFEREALEWETCLAALRAVIDAWVDVQRRWLYLDGLLAPGAATAVDIRTQLPAEVRRYEQCDADLCGIMRRVADAPRVLACLKFSVPTAAGAAAAAPPLPSSQFSVADAMRPPFGNLLAKLQQLGDAFDRVQRGLSEYLRRTRAAFPRLYFLGDDDCLDLLGSAASIVKAGDAASIARHLPRLFAGIASLVVERGAGEADVRIVAVESPESERLTLIQPVPITAQDAVTVWMPMLHASVCATVATHAQASANELLSAKSRDVGVSSDAGPLPAAMLQLLQPTPPSSSSTDGSDGGMGVTLSGQGALLGMWAFWTRAVEDCIAAMTMSVDTAASASAAWARLTQGLQDMLAAIAGALQQGESGVASAQWRKCFVRKAEHAIIEALHKRDVTRQLASRLTATHTRAVSAGAARATLLTDSEWTQNLRLYIGSAEGGGVPPSSPSTALGGAPRLLVSQETAEFVHGCEYVGLTERLVRTPLTDRCYFALTQALTLRRGGSPFGPAGTGKTETVKALGSTLGRLVLVFNCDEAFDFASMARLLCGLAESGCWGCFDEFNRLEERVLSAISQQILTIQTSLAARATECDIAGQSVRLHPDVGIFVTMNPGYAGTNPRGLPTQRLPASVIFHVSDCVYPHTAPLCSRVCRPFSVAR